MMMRPDMMATDVGTILEAREAVTAGLIDRIGGLSDAIAALESMIDPDHPQPQNAN